MCSLAGLTYVVGGPDLSKYPQICISAVSNWLKNCQIEEKQSATTNRKNSWKSRKAGRFMNQDISAFIALLWGRRRLLPRSFIIHTPFSAYFLWFRSNSDCESNFEEDSVWQVG